VTFLNGYDFGIKSHDVTIDELQVNSGSSASGGVGSSSSIAVSGRISYLSNPASQPVNCNVGIFAIGEGTGLLISSTPSNAGLYISNITSVVGVGSPQQPVIMYFTLANRNASIKYDANITIDHEWYPGISHGVNVTIPLVQSSIDNGNDFQFTPLTYSLHALITQNGVQLTLQSLATKNTVVVPMTPATRIRGFRFYGNTLDSSRSPYKLKTRPTISWNLLLHPSSRLPTRTSSTRQYYQANSWHSTPQQPAPTEASQPLSIPAS